MLLNDISYSAGTEHARGAVQHQSTTLEQLIPLVVTSLGFALGCFMLGINAVHLDRTASEPRPA